MGLHTNKLTKTWRVIVVWESWRIEWFSRKQRRVYWFSLFPYFFLSLMAFGLWSWALFIWYLSWPAEHVQPNIEPLLQYLQRGICLRCQPCWWQALGTTLLFFRVLSTYCAERPSISSYKYMVYTYTTHHIKLYLYNFKYIEIKIHESVTHKTHKKIIKCQDTIPESP